MPPRVRALVPTAVAVVAVFLVETVTYYLLRHLAWPLTGDSPSYVLESYSLAHFTLNPLPELRLDQLHPFVYAWPHGLPVYETGHNFLGPHGWVFAQGLGVPAIMAPFALLGHEPLPIFGFFGVIGLGFVVLHRRISAVLELDVPGQILVGVALAAPAILMAATQVYPDLLAGVLAAVALIEIVAIERTKEFSVLSCGLLGVALVVLPWLQIKFLAVDVILLLALALCALRARSWHRPGAVAGVVGVSTVVLVAYNLHAFGYILGLPQPDPSFEGHELFHMLALVVDRHQGFLIQVPSTVLGLAGFAASRRRNPIAALTTVLIVGAVIVINGSQPSVNAMGGTSLAGRFEWTVVPVLLVGSGFVAKGLEDRRTIVVRLVAVTALVWVVQGVLVAAGGHVLVNSLVPPHRSPSTSAYPGWWGWLNVCLPTFLRPRDVVAWLPGTVAVMALFGTAAEFLAASCRPDGRRRRRPASVDPGVSVTA